MINRQCGDDSAIVGAGVDSVEFAPSDLDLHARLLGSLLKFAQADRSVLGPVTGRPQVTGRPRAPSPGDHKGRPYYATASHAGAGIGAKERFFPFTLFPGEYHLS